jgi:hypothetical protein
MDNKQDNKPTDNNNGSKVRRSVLTKKNGWIAAAVLSCALIGVTGCAATSQSASSTSTPAPTSSAAASGKSFPAAGGTGSGSNARSGAAEGGSVGAVTSVSSTGFDLTTVAGQKVTVKVAASTTYAKGTATATESAVTKGETVEVLGMTSSTTVTASQVIVDPPASSTSPSYTPSAVIDFKQGSPSKANKDGVVPTDYTEGQGTIITGTTADKATEAALAVYPGGVVDRVVKLSDGEYEVHYIGANWPHHIFVTTSDTVVGAY